eukprot:6418029-Prymnesium_polylepis.1
MYAPFCFDWSVWCSCLHRNPAPSARPTGRRRLRHPPAPSSCAASRQSCVATDAPTASSARGVRCCTVRRASSPT